MPLVSVVVPCYNEQATICLLLNALYQQDYPRQDMEVIIADGRSSDNTRGQIEGFYNLHPDLCIRVIDNARRTIPSGLNCAISASQGEYIVRLDAHSVPYPDYVSRCVAALDKGLGMNVGGVWEIRPGNPGAIARAIAASASHPLGVGDAQYRFTNQAQQVDTVPFGAFRRSLIDQIGGFDETLLTNEDYEFNVRIRRAGGKIWLDPTIRSKYFARATIPELARQYWRYGYWKARMLVRYPETLRWRQGLPPLFVLSILVLLLLTIGMPVARWLLFSEIILYLLVLLLVSIGLALKKKDSFLLFGVPIAIGTMHISWGSALLWSLFRLKSYRK